MRLKYAINFDIKSHLMYYKKIYYKLYFFIPIVVCWTFPFFNFDKQETSVSKFKKLGYLWAKWFYFQWFLSIRERKQSVRKLVTIVWNLAKAVIYMN
jgi:hypothetical protein